MGHNAESRKRAEEKRVARRSAWFLSQGGCSVCGGTEDLEAHHVDPATKVSHSIIWTWREERLKAELLKCVVLCRAHHMKQHYPMEIHGTAARRRRGCRCSSCREWHRVSMQRWRASRKHGTVGELAESAGL